MNTNWINVSEKLPAEDVRVLVAARVRPGEMTVMIAWHDDKSWIVEDDQNWEGDCATHWQPLPELP